MINKIKILLLTATSLCGVAASSILTGCVNKTKELEVTNLKTALQYMSEYQSFALLLQNGSSAALHTIVYDKNAMGIESEEDPDLINVYYSDKNGTYQINWNGDELVGSEYRADVNVWDTDLFPKFQGLGKKTIDKLSDEDTFLSITDKEYKILFAKLITDDATNMVDINSISASYNAKGVTFNISYQKFTFIYLATNFGTASSDVADEYVNFLGKSALEVDYDLSCARSGMLSNNFKQDVYNYGEDEATTGYIYEYGYHEHYFTQKAKTSNYISGYISLHSPLVTDGDNPHPALKGIYFFSQDSSGFHLSQMPYNPSIDIVEGMNYPSRMLLWNNLHLVKEGVKGEMGDFKTKGVTYYVDNATLLADASNNLMSTTSFEGQQPVGLVLDAVSNSNGIDQFTIYYQFKLKGQNYCYPFPFYSFGKVNNETLNLIYDTYHTL
ncbi:MAG: hypothetical protein HUJ59_05370, partial [Bacilli bacterium]|nr:hypothetical protein [Bacilli bacterium]